MSLASARDQERAAWLRLVQCRAREQEAWQDVLRARATGIDLEEIEAANADIEAEASRAQDRYAQAQRSLLIARSPRRRRRPSGFVALTPARALLFVAPLEEGRRGRILVSVDVARCYRVVAVGAGDRQRHRPDELAGTVDRSQWGWISRDVRVAAPLGCSIGDVVVLDPHAPRLGRVDLGGEACDVVRARDLEAVIEGYRPGRVE